MKNVFPSGDYLALMEIGEIMRTRARGERASNSEAFTVLYSKDSIEKRGDARRDTTACGRGDADTDGTTKNSGRKRSVLSRG
jgi:hypothetical protein